ncbi:hypothetical protein ACI7RC_06405 [Brevibacillus sp. B_LB10_24]|uniref:hypothetical protein n=1 Tax=Brevibacillus sp. B_LB10_24 TaxID=3380645 RepID=UPI0038BB624B
MHMKKTQDFQPLGFGSIRLWDTGTNWGNIERSKGSFDFSVVDSFVDFAQKNGLDVIWTLGQPPAWATGGGPSPVPGTDYYNSAPPNNIQDWRDYLSVIGTRYKGKIGYYEIWNEANLSRYYSGTVDKLVELTREANQVLKAIDPGTKIVSPSFTEWGGVAALDAFMTAGGKYWIDIVGVHLYTFPGPPESVIDLAGAYQAVMAGQGVGNLPLWNTESTWNSFYYKGTLYGTDPLDYSVVMPYDLAISYLIRMYLCNWIAGVDRCYFYGIDYPWSRLRLLDLAHPPTLIPPGFAYRRMVDLLNGARTYSYSTTSDGVHNLSLVYSDGSQGYVLWADDDRIPPATLPFELKNSWALLADGRTQNGANLLSISKMPVFLKSYETHLPLPELTSNDNGSLSAEMLYNADFSLNLHTSPVPLGWDAGSMSVTSYTGADLPAGRMGIVLSPSSQYQQFRQFLRKPLKKGAKYRIAITYKLPGANPPGRWLIRLESGAAGTPLVREAFFSLPTQDAFRSKQMEFYYDYDSPDPPPDLRLTVINSAPAGQQQPIYLAGLSLRQMAGTAIEDQHAFRMIYSPEKPSSGSFSKGDQILFTDAALVQTEGIGWICTSEGTLGTLTGVTGSITSGSNLINLNVQNAVRIGDRIRLGSDTRTYTITVQKSPTQYELSVLANVTLTNQAVTYVIPTFSRLADPPAKSASISNAPVVLSVGASPYVYQNTNTYPVEVITANGTVNSIEFSRNGTVWYDTGTVSGIVQLSPNDRIRVKFTATPTMIAIPR